MIDFSGSEARITESTLVIGLVLPDVMGTYGDGGNAVVLRQRLRLRGIDAEVVENERRVAEATAKEEGKPEAALPKIIEGRVKGTSRRTCCWSSRSRRTRRRRSRRSLMRQARRFRALRGSRSVCDRAGTGG